MNGDTAMPTLLAWSEKDQDFNNPITAVTDDIVKVEIL